MEVKQGWKTTEFWLTALATLISLLFVSGVVHPGTGFDKTVGMITAVLATLGYSVARGAAKKNQDGDGPGWKTTEFWLTSTQTILGFVVASGAVDGTDADKAIGAAAAGLAAMGYAPVRAVAKSAGPKVIIFFAVLLSGCCLEAAVQREAEIKVFQSIGLEYAAYTSKDPELDGEELLRRHRNIRSWAQRLGEPIPEEAKDAND